jgi:ribonuclease HI
LLQHTLRETYRWERPLPSLHQLDAGSVPSTSDPGLLAGGTGKDGHQCVVPKILYAAPVWWSGTRYQKNPLEKVQHRALRLICAAFRTTPIKALEIEASVPPIHHQARLLSRRCGIRFNKLPESSLIIQRLGPEWRRAGNTRFTPPLPATPQPQTKTPKRTNPTTTLIQLAKFSDYKHERIDPFILPPWRRLQSAFGSRITITPYTPRPGGGEDDKKKTADKHNREIKTLSASTSNLIVYTDGSMVIKSGFKRIGAACVVYHMNEEVNSNKMGLGGHAEVYDAELAALMMGISTATTLAKVHGAHHIHIYADNTSAISSIFNPKPTGGQHYAITFYNKAVEFLDENEAHTINISWCPGHSGIRGNERADRLAKQATELARTSPIGVTRFNAIRRAKLATHKEWKQEWMKAPKQGWYAPADRIPPSLQPTKHAKALSTKRELFGRVVQARTGHGYTGEFRHRFFPTEPIMCPCGDGSIETREHILAACPRYNVWRWKLRNISRDIVLSEILGTPRGIEALSSFLESSGAFSRPETTDAAHHSPTIQNPTPNSHPEDEMSEHDDSSTVGPEVEDDEEDADHG